MGEVIELNSRKTKNKSPVPESFLIGMSIFKDAEGALSVDAEVGDGFTDFEVFEAIMAAAWHYAEEHGLVEEPEDDHN